MDIESQGHPAVVHPCASDLLCIGFFDGVESAVAPRSILGVPDRLVRPEDAETHAFPELWEALADTQLIGHNIVYDATVTGWWLKHKLDPLPVVADTMMSAYVLWPATKMADLGLDALGARLFGYESWKLSDYSDMRAYDPQVLYEYCARDCVATWDIHQVLWPMVRESPDRTKVMDTIIVPFLNMLCSIEPEGVSFDRDYLTNKLIPELEKQAGQSLALLQEMAKDHAPEEGWPKKRDPALSAKGKPVFTRLFNPASPKQVAQVLASRGHKVSSTNEESLKAVTEAGDGFAEKLLEYRGVTKNLNTYALSALRHDEDSMHPFPNSREFPNYNLFGTLTGRLSSSGPNIQNKPKTELMRRMYTASEAGRVLVESDYSQAELRVMAALSKDEWLIDIFADPTVDIFDQMMPSAFPNEEFIKGSERGTKLRRDLKTVIYGLSFGRGVGAIAKALKMPYGDAEVLVNNFLTSAHGLAAWRMDVIRALHDGRGLTSRFGRYFQQDVITPRNRAAVERSGLSFLPQSSASDCCLLAAIRLHKWIKDNGRDWKFMALVHDAINLDVREEEAEEASAVTRKFLVDSGEEYFPEVAWAAAGGWAWSWDAT